MIGHDLVAGGFQSLVPDLFNRQVYLMRSVCPFKDKSVLELGAMDGRHSAAALAMGARGCLAIEGRPERLAPTRDSAYTKDVDFLVADVRQMPLRNTTFDIVMAYGLLYHVANPVALIRTMRELCGETLFISTHCGPAETQMEGYPGVWWLERGWGDSMLGVDPDSLCWQGLERTWSFWLTEESLIRALEHNGFEVLRIEHYDVRGTPATWVAARP